MNELTQEEQQALALAEAKAAAVREARARGESTQELTGQAIGYDVTAPLPEKPPEKRDKMPPPFQRVREVLAMHPDWADEEVAVHAGVPVETVDKVRHGLWEADRARHGVPPPAAAPTEEESLPVAMQPAPSLAPVESWRAALAQAETPEEDAQIIRLTAAAIEWGRKAHATFDEMWPIAVLHLDACTQAGDHLATLERWQGQRSDLTLSHMGQSSPYGEALQQANLTRQSASRWEQLADLRGRLADVFEEFTARCMVNRNLPTPRGVLSLLRREARRREREALGNGDAALPPTCQLHVCNVSDAYRLVAPASVDVILTDPPYPADYLECFRLLAQFAFHALKPGGSLLCMSGQSYLPEVMEALGGVFGLQYHWTLAYLTPGGQAPQLWDRKVNSFWKPVLWFVKGAYESDWIGDVVKSDVNANEKEHHEWGQSESGMYDLARRFVKPGMVVVDPFLGGGTIGVVVLALGAHFIGMDVEEQAVATSRQRLGGRAPGRDGAHPVDQRRNARYPPGPQTRPPGAGAGS